MKVGFFLTLFLFVFISVNAQLEFSLPASLSVEAGKTGTIFNIVYDQPIGNKNWGVRGSLGSNFAKYLQAKMAGGGIYHLFGNKKKFLELGVDLHYLVIDEVSDDQRGVTLVFPNHSISTLYASANIGYRTYGRKNIFRVGLAPGFTEEGFIPGGYLSYGLQF